MPAENGKPIQPSEAGGSHPPPQNARRDLNQNLIPELPVDNSPSKTMRTIDSDLPVGGRAKAVQPILDRSSSDGKGSDTSRPQTPGPSHAGTRGKSVASNRHGKPTGQHSGRRPYTPFHFIVKSRCYGLMLDTKAAGATCHGIFKVDYRANLRQPVVPAVLLSKDLAASLKTPLPYRGICYKTVKFSVPTRKGKEPAELSIADVSFKASPDPSKVFKLRYRQKRPSDRDGQKKVVQQPSPSPSLPSLLGSVALYAIQHPVESAGKSMSYVRDQARSLGREWSRRQVGHFSLSEQRESVWKAAKRKWKNWTRSGRE